MTRLPSVYYWMGDSRPHLAAVPIYLADIFFRLAPVEHELMPAALAAKPEVSSAALDKHFVAAAAGVHLLHDKYITDSDVHLRSRPFLSAYI